MIPLFESRPPAWQRLCAGHVRPGWRHAALALTVVGLGLTNFALALLAQDAEERTRLMTTPDPARGVTGTATVNVVSKVPVEPGQEPLGPRDDPASARMVALLDTPWADWFGQFDARLTPRVHLVSIEPDAQNRIVDMEAEAAGLADLLAFGKALEASPWVERLDPQVHRSDAQDHAADAADSTGMVRMRWRLKWRARAANHP
ncbi:hypothetical protein ACLIJR_14415 [Hydrogenophaga sp. XSHU_21]